MYSLKQIAEITNTRFVGKNNPKINYFLNDSRSLQSANDTLFIALKTNRNNGHQYILNLIDLGVKAFLIEETDFDFAKFSESDVSFITSPKPIQTIQLLASYHRQQFNIPVIGITGSNGKTVVKEWLYQLLKNNYSICRSPKSYNSQIGVPLSVLNLNQTHTLAIFEAGISLTNEMDQLESIILPTIGILTSIGSAHNEGFKDKAEKISEKLKLFKGCKTIIINGLEKSQVSQIISENCTVVSEFNDADFKINFFENKLELINDKKSLHFNIPFSDTASFYNISTCITLMLKMGFKETEIEQKIKQLQAIALRLEIKNSVRNFCLSRQRG